ncbi:MAG: SPW repeat protein [Kiloniellaceae bacterium]
MSKRWQDWGNLVLGLWIFASPWVLQHTMATGAEATDMAANNAAMWSLYIVGIAVAALAVAALLAFQAWEEWTNLALGAWLFVSPWVLGFSSSALLMWNAVIVGALVVVLAGLAIAPPQGTSQGPAKHA